MKVALLTVSDRASAGTYEDKSGPAMVALLTAPGLPFDASVVATRIVPDEVSGWLSALREA